MSAPDRQLVMMWDVMAVLSDTSRGERGEVGLSSPAASPLALPGKRAARHRTIRQVRDKEGCSHDVSAVQPPADDEI